MRICYFDCFAGAAGDMIVAAMLDAGLDLNFLKKQLSTLKIEGLRIKTGRTKRCGLAVTTFNPLTTTQQHYRNLRHIIKILKNARISPRAMEKAVSIFEKIAAAEAKVHGRPIEEIHFHEIGAVDSIVDVVSACIGLEALGIEKVYCSIVSTGGGRVKMAHGTLPVPAPATVILAKGMPLVGGPIEAELLTPTGAAILAAFTDSFGPMPAMKITSTGYGAGTLDTEHFPNVVRLVVGESVEAYHENADSIYLLETNIDDVSGEVIGFAMDRLFEAGAMDVFCTPIYMKGSRPAVQMSAICEIKDVQQVERVFFEQGLTFGIRKQILQRSKLSREFDIVDTKFGRIKVKRGLMNGHAVNVKPEFTDCREAAERYKVPIKTVMKEALTVYKKTSR